MHDFFRLKIVSKRQVTLPQLLLEKLHLREGDELELEVEDGSIVAVRALKLVPTDFFSDKILQQLEVRSKSMDAGEKSSKPEAPLVAKSAALGLGLKAARSIARHAVRERSVGGA